MNGWTGRNTRGIRMDKRNRCTIVLFLLIRLFIGSFFLYTGSSKIFFISGFADEIYNYRLFPEFIIGFAAVFMPFLEIIAGLFLILGLWLKESMLIIMLSLASFILLISSALIRGLDISCGCMGYGKGNLETTLILDIIMLFLLLTAFFSERHLFTVDSLFQAKTGKIKNS